MPAVQQYNTITTKGVIGMILKSLETSLSTSWPGRLGMLMPSDQKTETYAWLGNSPVMREWAGGRDIKQLIEQVFTVTNKKYEATLGIARDDHRRDKLGVINNRIAQLSQRTVTHWASLASTIIINGESTLCYDKQNFFSASHSEGDSGTQTNLLTNTQVPALNVSDTANVTPLEMSKIILGIIQYFFTYKDDRGEPYHEDASAFDIMVPVALWSVAEQAIGLPNLDNGSSSVTNPLYSTNGKFQLTVTPNNRLTTATELYVSRTDSPAKALILQEEESVMIDVLGEGSDHAFKNDEYLYGVKAQRAVAPGYWQMMAKATIS